MVTQTFTIREFQEYINKLPTKLEASSEEINQEIAMSLQRRIRFRATGSLKNTKIEGTKKLLKLIGHPHWSYVNSGAAPDFPIPIQAIELNMSDPGITAGKKLKPFIAKEDITGWFQPRASSSKGFVDKSLATLNEDLQFITSRAIGRAFAK